MRPRVELIYAADCPNVPAAREALLRAFGQAGVGPVWSEWDSGDPEAPHYVRDFGSPTVLVNGRDIAPFEQSDAGPCCRLYSSDSKIAGSPPVDSIAAALRGASSSIRWAAMFATLPGAGAALLPAGPLCWPLYVGIVSTLGLGFLLKEQYVFPFAVTLLLVALAPLVHAAYTRRTYPTMLVGMIGASVVLIGKFAIASSVAQFGGVALLLGALYWSIRSRRNKACPRCEST